MHGVNNSVGRGKVARADVCELVGAGPCKKSVRHARQRGLGHVMHARSIDAAVKKMNQMCAARRMSLHGIAGILRGKT
jgi:hypothetical protein